MLNLQSLLNRLKSRILAQIRNDSFANLARNAGLADEGGCEGDAVDFADCVDETLWLFE